MNQGRLLTNIVVHLYVTIHQSLNCSSRLQINEAGVRDASEANGQPCTNRVVVARRSPLTGATTNSSTKNKVTRSGHKSNVVANPALYGTGCPNCNFIWWTLCCNGADPASYSASRYRVEWRLKPPELGRSSRFSLWSRFTLWSLNSRFSLWPLKQRAFGC